MDDSRDAVAELATAVDAIATVSPADVANRTSDNSFRPLVRSRVTRNVLRTMRWWTQSR